MKGEMVQQNPIQLIVQYYRCADPARQAEIDTCLRYNLLNPYLTAIHLLTEEQFDLSSFPNIEKIIQTVIRERLTFERGFAYANDMDPNGKCIWILSNADIYFDDTLRLVEWQNLDGVVYALTRHDIQADGSLRMVVSDFAHGCQDTWIFKSPLSMDRMFTAFRLGVSGCDGRIVHELIKSRYKVINPSIKIIARHLDLTCEVDIFKRNEEYAKLMTEENFMKGNAVAPPYQYYIYPVDQIDPNSFDMYEHYIRQLTELGVRPAELSRQIETHCRQLEEQSRQLGELGRKISTLEVQLEEANTEFQSLLQSLSWKLTKPLRKFHALFVRGGAAKRS